MRNNGVKLVGVKRGVVEEIHKDKVQILLVGGVHQLAMVLEEVEAVDVMSPDGVGAFWSSWDQECTHGGRGKSGIQEVGVTFTPQQEKGIMQPRQPNSSRG